MPGAATIGTKKTCGCGGDAVLVPVGRKSSEKLVGGM